MSYLFFVHSYLTSKIKTGNNGTESNDEITKKLLKSLIDGRDDFKFG